jgi:hypothetical protein
MSDRHEAHSHTTSAAAPDACGHDCDHDTGRRGFLRDGLMAVAALTAIAGGAAPLHAMARDYATGLARRSGRCTYDVPAADGATIDRANKLILVRYRGMVHAFGLECPHRGTMVQWQADEQPLLLPQAQEHLPAGRHAHPGQVAAEPRPVPGPARGREGRRGHDDRRSTSSKRRGRLGRRRGEGRLSGEGSRGAARGQSARAGAPPSPPPCAGCS